VDGRIHQPSSWAYYIAQFPGWQPTKQPNRSGRFERPLNLLETGETAVSRAPRRRQA